MLPIAAVSRATSIGAVPRGFEPPGPTSVCTSTGTTAKSKHCIDELTPFHRICMLLVKVSDCELFERQRALTVFFHNTKKFELTVGSAVRAATGMIAVSATVLVSTVQRGFEPATGTTVRATAGPPSGATFYLV